MSHVNTSTFTRSSTYTVSWIENGVNSAFSFNYVTGTSINTSVVEPSRSNVIWKSLVSLWSIESFWSMSILICFISLSLNSASKFKLFQKDYRKCSDGLLMDQLGHISTEPQKTHSNLFKTTIAPSQHWNFINNRIIIILQNQLIRSSPLPCN